MRNYFLLLTICICTSLIASEKNSLEIIQNSELSIYQAKLECQNELSTGTFQDCWLNLTHAGEAVEKVDIFINGGMPEHEHGLPTSPKITWSDEKDAYLIHGLKFSMPGNWVLKFKINHSDDKLKDQITMPVQVKD